MPDWVILLICVPVGWVLAEIQHRLTKRNRD